MNTKILIKNVKMNEGSTKRGITAVLTGVVVMYLTIKGAIFDYDQISSIIFSKVDFWVGLGLNLIGFLGIFIPDTKPDKPVLSQSDFPPIQLQARANEQLSIRQDLSYSQLQAGSSNPVNSSVGIPGLGNFDIVSDSDQLRSTGQVQTGHGIVNEETESNIGQSGWNG